MCAVGSFKVLEKDTVHGKASRYPSLCLPSVLGRAQETQQREAANPGFSGVTGEDVETYLAPTFSSP